MFAVRYAENEDKMFWLSLDRHIAERELLRKIASRECFVICDSEIPVGVLRYNLFWDNTPFLNMLYLSEPYRRLGFGRKAMVNWEKRMRKLGFTAVMTSTLSNEEAQHFYRKLGYRDAGCLILEGEPLEIVLTKPL